MRRHVRSWRKPTLGCRDVDKALDAARWYFSTDFEFNPKRSGLMATWKKATAATTGTTTVYINIDLVQAVFRETGENHRAL
jgi:hypothetical protein